MLNKAMIIGNLGADPEVRHTQSGSAVANLSVATNEKWTDKSGQKQERTEWHKVTVWGKQAESCEKYLTKGRRVYVEGRIQTRDWEDKDGNKRYTTEIVAHTVTFLGGDSGGGGGRPARSPQGQPQEDPFADTSSNHNSFDDDDIPF